MLCEHRVDHSVQRGVVVEGHSPLLDQCAHLTFDVFDGTGLGDGDDAVVAQDGGLAGYRWGIARKKKLLQKEAE